MNNIPKIIHQIWLQGEENLSNINKDKIKKTKEINNDFNYMLWDEIKIIEKIIPMIRNCWRNQCLERSNNS